MDDTGPSVIGRYQVLKPIGRGGMGRLFLARDPVIDRLLAIKVMSEGFDSIPLRERFAREARSIGKLRHPNIVSIFDVGEYDGRPFIAMEYIPGKTVAELIRLGTGSVAKKLHLIEQLCAGLAHAHKAGIVHRDVKPANLMVDDDGVLQLLDFGIARGDTAGVTKSGALVGTLNYMSPEQITSDTIDSRSDVFSAGAVAYELLSGRRAFPGDSLPVVMYRIIYTEPEPLGTLCPTLDPQICAIVHRALERSLDKRYQDIDVMRRNVSSVRRELEAGLSEDTAPAVPRKEMLAQIADDAGSLAPTVNAVPLTPEAASDPPPALEPPAAAEQPPAKQETVVPRPFPQRSRYLPIAVVLLVLVAFGSWIWRDRPDDPSRSSESSTSIPPPPAPQPVISQPDSRIAAPPSPLPKPETTQSTTSAVPTTVSSAPATDTLRTQPRASSSTSVAPVKPRPDPAMYSKAEELFNEGDYDGSINAYDAILAVAPDDVRARDARAKVLKARETEERIRRTKRPGR